MYIEYQKAIIGRQSADPVSSLSISFAVRNEIKSFPLTAAAGKWRLSRRAGSNRFAHPTAAGIVMPRRLST